MEITIWSRASDKKQSVRSDRAFLARKTCYHGVSFNLTRAYLRAGRTAQGLKVATDLSAQDPKNVQLHFTLGVLLAAERQYRVAQFELEKPIPCSPTHSKFFHLGQVYLRVAEYSKAELVLKRAQNLKPDSPEFSISRTGLRRSSSRCRCSGASRPSAQTRPENTDIISSSLASA